MNKKELLLKEWNDGVLRGAKIKLAGLLGMSRSAITQIVSGKLPLPERHIKTIAKEFGKSEDKIKEIFEVADKFDNNVDMDSVIPLTSENTVKLPILTSAECGQPDFCTIDERDIEDFTEIPIALFPGANFVVRCQGESMLPEISPKAFCIIKKMTAPLNNKNMLIQTSSGYTIKRVVVKGGDVSFYYLNPPGKKLEVIGEVKIIGKVLGSYQKY